MALKLARRLTRRKLGLIILFGLVLFYTLGTGFAFFYRLIYVLLLLLAVGLGWAWLNLRGIEVQLSRLAQRGQVGGYLEGQLRVINRNRLPKSWLEVREVSDLPGYTAGRGIGLVRDQSRAWRVEAYLARRGVFQVGQVEVTSQDPFGLFRLSRRFLQPREFLVLPAPEPLPDLDPRLANLPSDSRVTRRSDHITPDSSTVRQYSYGDSFRRIHWPYTARMNNLMVKEFDVGISAEAWVLVDMHRSPHFGADAVDNTEELAVTAAASLITRLDDLSMPVGLAASADQSYIFRPDSSPAQVSKLMEALARVKARGDVSLERFIYDLRPHLNRFNTLTVITPSRRNEWVSALSSLRRQGVMVSAIYIDPVDFGAPADGQSPLESLLMSEILTYVLKRGRPINEGLRAPLQSGAYTAYSGSGSAGPSTRQEATP
jgi:uncharacterized protein (DUF58 family)